MENFSIHKFLFGILVNFEQIFCPTEKFTIQRLIEHYSVLHSKHFVEVLKN